MRKFAAPVLLLLLVTAALSAPAKKGAIRLPDLPQPPSPPPDPAKVAVITADVMYMFDADEDGYVILTSPAGIVKVMAEPGPLRVKGRFVDAPDKVTTKTFTGKNVYTLEPIKSGRFELLIVPPGATGEADVIRRIVDCQLGPQPPPPPPPPPPPGPSPIPVEGNRVLIVYDRTKSNQLPQEQQDILYETDAFSVRAYLNSKCILGTDNKTREWRIWDASTDASNEAKLWQDVLKRNRTSLPWIVISTGHSGYEGPLPATVADTIKLIKQYFEPAARKAA
jgi:hypothetical protein